MHKDQQEALRRLEKALLDAEPQEADFDWDDPEEASDQWLEEAYRDDRQIHCDAYNTDSADVDMDSYSQAVLEAPKKKGRAGFLLLLLLGGLAFVILKKWGIL